MIWEPDTSFKVIAGMFVSTFRRKDYSDEGVEKTVEKDSERWSERWSEKQSERWSEKQSEGWSEKWSELNENQRRIVELMAENPLMSRKELSVRLGINQSAIQKNIEMLKKKDMIKRIGPAKGGHWEVVIDGL